MLYKLVYFDVFECIYEWKKGNWLKLFIKVCMLIVNICVIFN